MRQFIVLACVVGLMTNSIGALKCYKGSNSANVPSDTETCGTNIKTCRGTKTTSGSSVTWSGGCDTVVNNEASVGCTDNGNIKTCICKPTDDNTPCDTTGVAMASAGNGVMCYSGTSTGTTELKKDAYGTTFKKIKCPNDITTCVRETQEGGVSGVAKVYTYNLGCDTVQKNDANAKCTKTNVSLYKKNSCICKPKDPNTPCNGGFVTMSSAIITMAMALLVRLFF